jgi:hypothetical protein
VGAETGTSVGAGSSVVLSASRWLPTSAALSELLMLALLAGLLAGVLLQAVSKTTLMSEKNKIRFMVFLGYILLCTYNITILNSFLLTFLIAL